MALFDHRPNEVLREMRARDSAIARPNDSNEQDNINLREAGLFEEKAQAARLEAIKNLATDHREYSDRRSEHAADQLRLGKPQEAQQALRDAIEHERRAEGVEKLHSDSHDQERDSESLRLDEALFTKMKQLEQQQLQITAQNMSRDDREQSSQHSHDGCIDR